MKKAHLQRNDFMKRRIYAIAAGLAFAFMSAAAPSALAASATPHSVAAVAHIAAPAKPTAGIVRNTTICAHTNTKYCVDVVGDKNTAGTKVWLYPNGADDKWDIVPSTQNCQFQALQCYFFEDAQNTRLCLSATGNDGAPIELENCNDIGAWNDASKYYLFNGDYGQSGSLDAQAIGTHDYLYALSGTDGGKYRQWTVYGWN